MKVRAMAVPFGRNIMDRSEEGEDYALKRPKREEGDKDMNMGEVSFGLPVKEEASAVIKPPTVSLPPPPEPEVTVVTKLRAPLPDDPNKQIFWSDFAWKCRRAW